MTLFVAYGHFITETSNSQYTPVCVFFDRSAAEQFVREENDEVGADMLEIDEVPLFDNYGYPVSPAELGMIG